MKRKLTAAVCCLLMALGGLAVTASPSAAHGEQSCTTTYVQEPRLVLTSSSPVRYTWKVMSVPYTSCTTSYNHTHTFCQQWQQNLVNPDNAGNDGHVEVGSVGQAICVLWVTRGH